LTEALSMFMSLASDITNGRKVERIPPKTLRYFPHPAKILQNIILTLSAFPNSVFRMPPVISGNYSPPTAHATNSGNAHWSPKGGVTGSMNAGTLSEDEGSKSPKAVDTNFEALLQGTDLPLPAFPLPFPPSARHRHFP
jgi:hypothetical protein